VHNGLRLAVVADFGTRNFNLKTKFDMENKTSTNHENGNDANRLLAAVNPFIANTAKDYDMSYESVEVYYNRYGSTAMFYEKLEEHIKQRSF
jgi:hypothetical protein